MISTNYKTIMIGYYLVKLYGLILESELNVWAERNICQSAEKAGY